MNLLPKKSDVQCLYMHEKTESLKCKMVFSFIFFVEQRTTVGDICSDPGLTDVLIMGVLIEGF